MVYYYLFSVFLTSKVLFSRFLQFKGTFVDELKNSQYRDWASLNLVGLMSLRVKYLAHNNT